MEKKHHISLFCCFWSFIEGTNNNFSVCSIIFLENIGHDEYVERNKKCEKVIFRGGENPSKMTIFWPKKQIFKTLSHFRHP